MQAKHKWGNSTAKGTESYTSGVAGGRQDTAALPAQSHNVEMAEPLPPFLLMPGVCHI